MDISRAALPPRTGKYSRSDEAHPLFPLYREKLNSCARLLIDAPNFRDYVYQYERDQRDAVHAAHVRFPEFQQWVRDNRAGGRPCLPNADFPQGRSFPQNFVYWLDGGRW